MTVWDTNRCDFCSVELEDESGAALWKTPYKLSREGDRLYELGDEWKACDDCDTLVARGFVDGIMELAEKRGMTERVRDRALERRPDIAYGEHAMEVARREMRTLFEEIVASKPTRVRHSRTKAKRALEAGAKAVNEFYSENIAGGGVCDFCTGPLGDKSSIWATDIDLSGMATIGDVGLPVPYGREWACCPECEPLVSNHDVMALATRSMALRRRPFEFQEVYDGWTDEHREVYDRETFSDTLELFDALYQFGLHRVLQFPQPKIPLDTTPETHRSNWHEAMDAQADLLKFMRTPYGMNVLRHWAHNETVASPEKAQVYKYLLHAEEPKLLGASPVYVAEEFCDLIDHARQSFKPEKLMPEDVLIPQAFIYFARPIFIHDRHGHEVNVKAISYCPAYAKAGTDPRVDKENHGIALTFYSTMNDFSGRDDWPEEARALRRSSDHAAYVSDLAWLHLAPVWFDVDPSREEIDVDHPNELTGFEEWWALIQVTLRLMLERIASKTRRYADRHTRKRAGRAGLKLNEIVVIHLRRPRAHGNPDDEREGGREYSHRFRVTGHWRNQYYPSLEAHRQRWISEYIKGPEDKPFIDKRKVYQWDR